ncbi:MAG TPA: OmpA family protein [Opitutaceae bacterium]
MNLLSKKLLFVVFSAAVVLTGCTKKPKRPTPDQTMLGRDLAGSGDMINPNDIGGAGLTEANSGLALRDGAMDVGNQIRGQLDPVYFDFDKSAIKASERPKLQAAQQWLSEHPGYRLLLEGHCDWRGTAEYNLGLGDRRAGASKQYLQTLGVNPADIETLSKGDLDAVENASEDQATKDRRVELVLIKPTT